LTDNLKRYFDRTTNKMVTTRSMTRAAAAASAAYFDRLHQSIKPAPKKEEVEVAQILVSMKKSRCALTSCSSCYMEDKRPFISEGMKVFKTYIDGVGDREIIAPFWTHYCPPCQEYWKNHTLRRSPRIAAKKLTS
jgi:thiol-disulfide isomerase/thioredoxin